MDIRWRRVCRPSCEVWNPSTRIWPSGSAKRNRADIRELFPAPVRPTMPICNGGGESIFTCWNWVNISTLKIPAPTGTSHSFQWSLNREKHECGHEKNLLNITEPSQELAYQTHSYKDISQRCYKNLFVFFYLYTLADLTYGWRNPLTSSEKGLKLYSVFLAL